MKVTPSGELNKGEKPARQPVRNINVLWETMIQGVVYQDAAGKIISMNPAAERILGKSPQDFIGKTSIDVEGDSIREDGSPFPGLEHPSMVALRTGKAQHNVVMGVYNPREKAFRWISISAVPLFRKGEKQPYQVYTLFNDVTERKQMGEELLKSKDEKYRLLVENADEGVAVAQDEFFKYCNPKMSEMTGYSQAELVATPFTELAHPDDREIVLGRYRRRIQGEKLSNRYEFRITHKDGSIRWVNINAIAINWEGRPATLNLFTDITVQKQAEDKLRDSEVKFRTLMERSPDAILLIDEEGQVIEINQSAGALFGLNPKETLGRYTWDVQFSMLPPERRTEQMYQLLKTTALSALQTGESPFLVQPMEAVIQLPDGSRKTFRQVLFAIKSQKGYRIGSISHDITEQKRLSDEIKSYTRRLIEVQEEERKRISRELHDEAAQYLALLTLEIDGLITDRANSPELVISLKKIRGIANKAIQEVRRYSHELRPIVLEHFGLPEALGLIVNEFKTKSPIGISFKTIGAERRLKEDEELALFRITQEALSNIRNHSQASKARVALTFTPVKVRLVISDNGQGFEIPKKKAAASSTGMGLVGMRERAELIGAALKVNSRIGAGTIISVELPTPKRETDS